MSDVFRELIESIKSAKEVVVLAHYNPDGDAYSASCGLALALKLLGKSAQVINESPNSERYFFIPGVKEVLNSWPSNQPDLVIVVDCGDLSRVGETFKGQVASHPNVINIDHHKSNGMFGRLNWVIEKSSSTAELIYELIEGLKVPWNKELSTCVLTGIVSDTGSFRYASTTVKTLEIASRLVGQQADLAGIARNLFEERSPAAVQLQAHLLANMQFHAAGKIVKLFATEADVTRFGAVLEDLDGVVEEARAISGVVVSILIRQDKDIWRISMRSKSSQVDLSEVAKSFGGGGHKAAAAFRWRKDPDQLKQQVVAAVEAEIIRAGA